MQITIEYLEGWYKKSTPLLHHFLKNWSHRLSQQDREDIISESMVNLITKINKGGIEVRDEKGFNSYVFSTLRTVGLNNIITNPNTLTEEITITISESTPDNRDEGSDMSNLELIEESKEVLYKIPPSVQRSIIKDRVENKMNKEDLIKKYKRTRTKIRSILKGTYEDPNEIYVNILDARVSGMKLKEIGAIYGQTPKAIERKLYKRINPRLNARLNDSN